MSIFQQSTCRSSSLSAAAALGMLTVAVTVGGTGEKGRDLPLFLQDFQGASGKARALPLFLDDFFANTETPVIAKEVQFPSAVGPCRGYWARPDNSQPLPAALLVFDEDGWTEWMNTSVRHLASIGYEVLGINLRPRRIAAAKLPPAITDESSLAELSAAVRWLRGRISVTPNRLGIVGWGWSGSQALALASAMPVQACIVCDTAMPTEPGLVAGLRGTPVLVIHGAADEASFKTMPAFRKLATTHQLSCKFHVASAAGAGFMGPPMSKAYAHDVAEDAWVAIYHFLEKHVEDVRPGNAGLLAEPAIALKPVATIADIMRVVNEPAGLRGVLSKALLVEPKTARQWGAVRATAAMVAEAGGMLEARTPAKGPVGHWKKQARAFTAAAEHLVDAADRQDFGAAQRGLVLLAETCAVCHDEHR